MGKKKRAELYNLDITLGKLIAEKLKMFERAAVGAPTCFTDAVVDGELKEIRTAKEAEKVWHGIIKQMIWSFQEIGEGRPHEPVSIDYPDWKEYKQKHEEYCERVQKGIDLFAEYYQSLWF